MTPILAAVSFLLYGVIGWTIDTGYRSFEARRFVRGGFSRYPFSPVYGFGALLAISVSPLFRPWPIWAEGAAYALVMGAYEYASGAIVVAALKRRLWDYRRDRWNIGGHTSPFHACVWALLSLLVVYVLHPAVAALIP